MHDAALARIRAVVRLVAPTNRDCAERIGMEPTKLSKSLHGTRRFTVAELAALAAAGGTSVDWLLQGRGPGPERRTEVAAATDDGLRHRFVDAAWRLIAERGFHAVRVADIADACGTSSAAVHYHFPSKQGLLEEAMLLCVRRAATRHRAALAAGGDAEDRLRRLIDAQVPDSDEVVREWGVWLQYWAETAVRPELRAEHAHYHGSWRAAVARVIDEGMTSGVFRRVDPDDVAVRFTALVDGLGIQVLTGSPAVSADRMRALLLDVVRRELGRPDAGTDARSMTGRLASGDDLQDPRCPPGG